MDIVVPSTQDTVKVNTLPSTSGTARASRRDKRRKRKLPGAAKLLIALFVIAGVAGGVYMWSSQPAAATETTITMPVMQGDINLTVESNGNVQATREEIVAYETEGNVVEVMVEPGDPVEAGQPLVRLTDDEQEQAVTQAQAALNTTQAELDDLKRGSSASEIASAQADVQSAQAALDKVKAGASAKEIADAEAEVREANANLATVLSGATAQEIADAEADLKAAQATYSQVAQGATAQEIADTEADLKAARAAYRHTMSGASTKDIGDAEADLKAAQAKLDTLMEPASTAEIAEAESQLRSAQAQLAALQAKPTSTERSAANLAVSQAEGDLKQIQIAAGLSKKEKELALAKSERELQTAQRSYGAVAGELLNEDGELTVDASSPRYEQYWTSFNALKDAEAAQVQAMAELENVRQKEIEDVSAAQAKIVDANAQLAEVMSGATAEELAAAQWEVASAQKALNDLSAGPAADERASAEAEVAKAQNTLDELKAGATQEEIASAEVEVAKAQNALDALRAGPTQDDLASAEADVVKAQGTLDQLRAGSTEDERVAAQTALDKARNNLVDLQSGPTADEIAAAEATVAQKQATLASVMEPASASEIAAAEEVLANSRKDLADAQAEVDMTVLTAPFSGIVSSVSAEPGGVAIVGEGAVTIYDAGGVSLQLAVNESDIQQVKEGQQATITLDALPNVVLTGTVSSVAYTAGSSQDVVTYQVDVEFDPKDLPIKNGMSAAAAITVESHPNVIEVPSRAIKTQGNRKTLEVLYGEDQTPVTVQVVTGATDGTMTEIVGCVETNSQCLRDGDQLSVTIPASTGSTANNGPQEQLIMPPGAVFQVGPDDGSGGEMRGPITRPLR